MTDKLTVANQSVAISDDVLQSLILDGDLSKMTGKQKVEYYLKLCSVLELDPSTQPFGIIKFPKGGEKIYALKSCTEQLRNKRELSVTELVSVVQNGYVITKCKIQDKTGRTDIGTGVVSVAGLSGDAYCNAVMKAETKAKRRTTLSMCGLGMLDETETDTVGNFQTAKINIKDSEITINDILPDEKEVDVTKSNPYIQMSKANTLDELKEIWMRNIPLQQFGEFKALKETRKEEIEFNELHKEFHSDSWVTRFNESEIEVATQIAKELIESDLWRQYDEKFKKYILIIIKQKGVKIEQN